MALGDVYQIRLWQKVKDEHFVTRFHYMEIGLCSDLRPAERLAIRFNAVIVASMVECLSNAWKPTWIDTGRVLGERIPRDQEVLDNQGVVNDTSVAPLAAVVCNLNTGADLPSVQGRFYLSGIPTTLSNAGIVTATWLTLAEPLRQNLTTTLVSALAGGGAWRLCLWQPGYIEPRLVRVVAFRPNLGTMRTRRRRPSLP